MVLGIVLLSACVSVDPAIKAQRAAPGGVALVAGRFSCVAKYRSDVAGLLGPSIEQVVSSTSCTTAVLAWGPDGGFVTSTFDAVGTLIGTRFLTQKDGLSKNTDTLVLKRHGCASEEIQTGCIKDKFTIFANQDGDLVIVQTGGGGGLVGILPAFVYGDLMSIFPRLDELPRSVNDD